MGFVAGGGLFIALEGWLKNIRHATTKVVGLKIFMNCELYAWDDVTGGGKTLNGGESGGGEAVSGEDNN